MSATRYVVDFGSSNSGGAPTFTVFKRLDTLANLTPPAVVEIGSGEYYFEYDWTTSPTGFDTITFKVTLNGIELSDVISGVPPEGTATVSAGSTSLAGFDTAKNIINRAAIQVKAASGVLSSLPDPFASTDANILQMIELLNTLGDDLNNDHNWSQFVKEATIVTAASATTYALPADFHEMFDQSGWNRSMRLPLVGPLSSQETQFLKARLGNVIINVAFRIEGNLMVFPIAPANGQTIVFEYLSDYWVETASATTGPDARRVSAATDYVCYDPDLMVAGLKLAWLENSGFDTSMARARYEKKLAHCIGKNVGARVLSMGGSGLSSDRFLDQNNVPPTNFG